MSSNTRSFQQPQCKERQCSNTNGYHSLYKTKLHIAHILRASLIGSEQIQAYYDLLKFHNPDHKIRLRDPVSKQTEPLHPSTYRAVKVLFNIIFLSMRHPLC